MEVERMSNTPSGTVSKSALLLTIRNFSRLIVRNGIQVILVAMAGARMTALRTFMEFKQVFCPMIHGCRLAGTLLPVQQKRITLLQDQSSGRVFEVM